MNGGLRVYVAGMKGGPGGTRSFLVTTAPGVHTMQRVTSREEPSCRELAELVTDYLEDALTPAERAACERHLRGCGDCRGYLDQMRETIAALGELAPGELPAARREELLASFRAWAAACR
jgi:Putative zinc-finger